MSARIALEIAAELETERWSVAESAAKALREQHAEIERLTAERDEAIAAAVDAEIALTYCATAIRARAKP